MNRRIDRFLPNFTGQSCDFFEVKQNIDPVKDGIKRVTFTYESCEDISKRVLNPEEVNIESLIMSGVKIDPKDFVSVFNLTDPADLDSLASRASDNIMSYVNEHKNEFFVEPKSE